MRRTALALLLALLFLSCKESRSVPPPSADVPIFIISIDTLRSDRLPIYGYRGVQTPNIDALRADGILYEHAYAHTPLTLPSHTSLFTGLLPADHGVRDNIGYSLKDGVPTIAELLKTRGYATGAAVSSFVLRAETGVARGFDFYEDDVEAMAGKARFIGNIQRVGGATVSVASEWIAKQQKPVFFFLHLYDPHTPYEAPEPFRSQYANRYDGEIAYSDHV
ncbi:MAG TPA: sulfatase-like hydrolase/transferase, partial [Thermoanaerobaculia bacterium]|nr:sulfatase-like hydrolase/transferase [Thermoanaerobaculia bacterium]